MRYRILKLGVFIVLSSLWLVFAVALIFNWQLLDTAWLAFRSWPPAVQLLAGLIFLPVVAGLWIWETSWPFLLRLVLLSVLARVSVYAIDPRKTWTRPAFLKESA